MPAYPNLFIVGAQKAGTTSLHDQLGRHPEIFMSPDKEPRFFNALADGRAGPDAEERYLALFEEGADHPVRGEASVQYLHHPEVPELIDDRVPDARILVSLRDPIQRAYSNYWRKVAAGTEEAGFAEAVDREIEAVEAGAPLESMTPGARRRGYLDRSLYAEPLERYLDAFGHDRVHVVLLADLRDDPVGTLEGILAFLDVDPAPAPDLVADERRNAFRGVPYGGLVERVRTSPTVKRVAQALLPKGVRDWLGNRLLLKDADKPPVPDAARRRLASFFEPDVRRLEELLGRDLPELRASFPAGTANLQDPGGP